MLQVVRMDQNPLGKEASELYLDYVVKKQDEEKNFYDLNLKKAVESGKDALEHFYFLINEKEIIGCCGLVLEDVVLERNLYPWISSLYIKEDYRGNSYGQLLLNHVMHKAEILGYDTAYLTTGETEYYLRQNWTKLDDYTKQLQSGKVYYKRLDERR